MYSTLSLISRQSINTLKNQILLHVNFLLPAAVLVPVMPCTAGVAVIPVPDVTVHQGVDAVGGVDGAGGTPQVVVSVIDTAVDPHKVY